MSRLKRFIISLFIPIGLTALIFTSTAIVPRFTAFSHAEAFGYTIFGMAIIFGIACAIYFVWGDLID